MRARVKQTFRWHPNPNSTATDEYTEGAVLEGPSAEAAFRYGFGEEIKEEKDESRKAETAPLRKAHDRAPRNKGQ